MVCNNQDGNCLCTEVAQFSVTALMVKGQAAAATAFLPITWEIQGLEERDGASQSCCCVYPQDFVPTLEPSWKARFPMDKGSLPP